MLSRIDEIEAKPEDVLNLVVARSIAEKRTVISALNQARGNISKTAKLLDISRPTLYSLIERLGIKIED